MFTLIYVYVHVWMCVCVYFLEMGMRKGRNILLEIWSRNFCFYLQAIKGSYKNWFIKWMVPQPKDSGLIFTSSKI